MNYFSHWKLGGRGDAEPELDVGQIPKHGNRVLEFDTFCPKIVSISVGYQTAILFAHGPTLLSSIQVM